MDGAGIDFAEILCTGEVEIAPVSGSIFADGPIHIRVETMRRGPVFIVKSFELDCEILGLRLLFCSFCYHPTWAECEDRASKTSRKEAMPSWRPMAYEFNIWVVRSLLTAPLNLSPAS